MSLDGAWGNQGERGRAQTTPRHSTTPAAPDHFPIMFWLALRTPVHYGHPVNDEPTGHVPSREFGDPWENIGTPPPTDPAQGDAIGDPGWNLGTLEIPPNIAKGLVACQAAASNVEFDATNTHHRYAYATAAAVVAMARKAFAAGELALMRVATTVEPRDDRLPRPEGSSNPYATLYARYLLTHASGEAIVIEASIDIFPGKGRPTDKAQGAAITALGKYVRAGLCGIGWAAESGEDIDQRDDSQGNGPQGHHNQQQYHQPPPPQQPAPKPKHPNALYQGLLDAAKTVLRGSKIETEKLWTMVTGMSSMPREPAPHMLQAVIDGGRNLRKYIQLPDFPDSPSQLSHSQYLSFCEEMELTYSMDHGEPNPIGLECDGRVSKGGPTPGLEPVGDKPKTEEGSKGDSNE